MINFWFNIFIFADQISEYKFVRFSRRTTASSIGPNMDYHPVFPGIVIFGYFSYT